MRRVLVVGVLVVLLGSTAQPAAAQVRIIDITYSLASQGRVRTSIESFAAGVDRVLRDPRGWSLGGSLRFRRVASGGHIRFWIASDAMVPTWGGYCTRYYSCQPGRDIVINDDRWSFGSKYWPGSVERYHHLVINHELGHWLGFRHVGCPARGALAPVAMQQSKGLDGCVANEWPTPQERLQLARARGVAILPLPHDTTSSWWTARADGGVFTRDGGNFYGSLRNVRLNAPVVDIAATHDASGYWLAASDGGVFTFGSAHFAGSLGAIDLRAPIVAMAPTSSGRGYWLAAADGGVFTFGDAPFLGSGANSGAIVADIVAVDGGYDLVTTSGSRLTYR